MPLSPDFASQKSRLGVLLDHFAGIAIHGSKKLAMVRHFAFNLLRAANGKHVAKLRRHVVA